MALVHALEPGDLAGVDEAGRRRGSGCWKVSTLVVLVLVTLRAEWISSLSTTSTPRPRAPGVGGGGHRVVQVARAVGADRRGRPHRADQHHRLVALDHQVQEVRGLLHGVGAVGDDDAVDVVARPARSLTRLASFSQTASFMSWLPMLATCSPVSVGELVDVGHGLDQVLDLEGARLVAVARTGRLGAGDGAAGGEDLDGRPARLRRSPPRARSASASDAAACQHEDRRHRAT